MRPTLFRSLLLSLVIGIAACGDDDDEFEPEEKDGDEQGEVDTPSTSKGTSKSDGSSCGSLGSIDNCTKCGDRCELPKGADKETTKAVCLSKSKGCGFKCAGGWYDISDKDDQGCEVQDEPEGENDKRKRVSKLDTLSDCDDPVQYDGNLPSDDNNEAQIDVLRIEVNDEGYGTCWIDTVVTVDLRGLPKDGKYEVKAEYLCSGDDEPVDTESETLKGGEDVVWDLDADCDGGDDSGEIVVTIEKTDGEHSAAEYELTVDP